jgi:hypothetical protein
VKLAGDKDALEETRKDFAVAPELGGDAISGITPTRLRQVGVEDVIFAVALNLPVWSHRPFCA